MGGTILDHRILNGFSRYSANDPINNMDHSGLSWLSHAMREVGDVFEYV